LVAAGVRWVHGAPAIVVRRNGDAFEFVDLGVFVGPIPQDVGQTIRVT
jgi:hypothetical protein